jgi:hypothetical protein
VIASNLASLHIALGGRAGAINGFLAKEVFRGYLFDQPAIGIVPKEPDGFFPVQGFVVKVNAFMLGKYSEFELQCIK